MSQLIDRRYRPSTACLPTKRDCFPARTSSNGSQRRGITGWRRLVPIAGGTSGRSMLCDWTTGSISAEALNLGGLSTCWPTRPPALTRKVVSWRSSFKGKRTASRQTESWPLALPGPSNDKYGYVQNAEDYRRARSSSLRTPSLPGKHSSKTPPAGASTDMQSDVSPSHPLSSRSTLIPSAFSALVRAPSQRRITP